jgi:sugar transferase EpsL
MSGSRWLLSAPRRWFDIAVAGAVLVAASPVIAATALTVRIRLGSPVIFRQQRAGLHGEPFELLKFRTMTSAVDADGDLLSDQDRLTAFGVRLRASSLDELPQLWCVLRGDMSLIGPRPLLLHYNDHYSPTQRRRLEARPGLTGWAQVNGRNGVDWPAKLAHDADYVEQASPWRDLQILLRTPTAILSRRGITDGRTVTSAEFVGQHEEPLDSPLDD